MAKVYKTIKDMTEYFNVHENTIRTWMNDKEMPHFKIGMVLRFDMEEVERWANETGKK